MQTQIKIKGRQRRRFATSVETQIERAVERESKKFNVSRSFVIATALAFTFNIDISNYKNGKAR